MKSVDLSGDPHQLLTARQAAVFLAISMQALAKRRRRGDIHATQISDGKRGYRYKLSELYRYIDEHTS